MLNGLERLVARHVSYWELKLLILACDQCSAIKHRLAAYLTTASVCDIRHARKRNKNAGLITVDVKDTFDIVLRNYLIFRLRPLEWPV